MSSKIQKLFKQSSLGLFPESQLIGHLELAEELVETSKKTLAQKNSGKFYTPKEIFLPLVNQTISAFESRSKREILKIIDPFCGDGRLIVSLLPKISNLATKFEFHIWDYDEEAIISARTQIQKTIDQFKINGTIISKKTDTFSEFFRGNENNFDLVITNPPWEVIKPDPKDIALISDQGKKEKYVANLKEFSNRLLNDFPLSRPEKAYGGWGVNLARVGTELSVRLAKDEGLVSIVTPSTIFADQNSSQLRKWLFTQNNLKNLNIYPAELKLFTGVDQPSVSFILEKSGIQKDLNVTNYSKLSSPITSKIEDVKSLLISTNNILPISAVTNLSHLKILSSFSQLPRLNELEGEDSLWLGRELDETNYRSWLSIQGNTRFIKGRDIERFNLIEKQDVYINESILKTKIPLSTKYFKIAWRDIARPTQKRRVIATIIPPGYAAGNSLGVLYVKTGDRKKLTALLGLLSSFVFEFQLRAYLATAHVSAGVMRKIRIPNWDTNFIDSISGLVEKRLSGDVDSEIPLEIQIAKSYGLKRTEFQELLQAFPKISNHEADRLLSANLWNI